MRAREIAEFLVRERLQRRRVEHLAARSQRPFHCVLGHECLAGARRGGNQHRASGIQRVEGPDLEVVEVKAARRFELGARGHPGAEVAVVAGTVVGVPGTVVGVVSGGSVNEGADGTVSIGSGLKTKISPTVTSTTVRTPSTASTTSRRSRPGR